MSVLMWGKEMTFPQGNKEGWAECGDVLNTGDRIEQAIADNNENQERIKVSIPSPLARFELMQSALANISSRGWMGATSAQRLMVSQALDLAQLVFEGGNAYQLREWNLGLMQPANHAQALYKQALEQYMQGDMAYGLDPREGMRLILDSGYDPLGMTSPVSLFIPRAEARPHPNIRIDGDKALFAEVRSLEQRSVDFIKYLCKLAHVYRPQLQGSMSAWSTYIDRTIDNLGNSNWALYEELNRIRNSVSYQLKDYLEEYSDLQERTPSISIGGERIKLLSLKKENVGERIFRESDLSIETGDKPLILSNAIERGVYRYYDAQSRWGDNPKHVLNYAQLDHSKLPGTDIAYPWLCEDDFLADQLIKLPYRVDTSRYYCLQGQQAYYLLPIKARFLDYFPYSYLMDNTAGTPNIQVEESPNGSVLVKLLIRAKGGSIILRKRYFDIEVNGLSEDQKLWVGRDKDEAGTAAGVLVNHSVALNIFPFVRLAETTENHYRLQLITYREQVRITKTTVELYSATGQRVAAEPLHRSQGETQYYRLEGQTFDYIRFVLRNDTREIEAYLIPRWGEPRQLHGDGYIFSFDFGTTNSYISVLPRDRAGAMPEELVLTSGLGSMLAREQTSVFSLMVKTRLEQEFVPQAIGDGGRFGFPMRTVVAHAKDKPKHEKAEALLNSNIAFLFGKGDGGGDTNKIESNIKWSHDGDQEKASYAEAYIEEMLFLARAFAIEQGSRLSNCRLTWTYPLSMTKIQIAEFEEIWRRYTQRYFRGAPDPKRELESIAPYLYYKRSGNFATDTALSIDIGGGTCDVSIIPADRNQLPEVLSFRLAGDSIFGAWGSNISKNAMICDYLEKFKQRFGNNDEVWKMLDFVIQTGAAMDINSALFALESITGDESNSYNAMLRRDAKYRPVFIYFYAAIIYYLGSLLREKGQVLPRRILFSGTGSKLLNIIGSKPVLQELTNQLFDAFTEGACRNPSGPVELVMELERPKQLTAIGAAFSCREQLESATEQLINYPTIAYTMVRSLGDQTLLSGHIQDATTQALVVEDIAKEVERFNKLCIDLFEDYSFATNYCGSTPSDFIACLQTMQRDVRAYLREGLESQIPRNETSGKMPIMDAPFFYPIKAIIEKALEVK